MKSKNRTEEDLPLVRIRVKERIGKVDRRERLGQGEKLLLLILGACLGLGIGYIVAGKIMNYLRSPVAVSVPSGSGDASARAVEGAERSSPAAELDFDLPFEGN